MYEFLTNLEPTACTYLILTADELWDEIDEANAEFAACTPDDGFSDFLQRLSEQVAERLSAVSLAIPCMSCGAPADWATYHNDEGHWESGCDACDSSDGSEWVAIRALDLAALGGEGVDLLPARCAGCYALLRSCVCFTRNNDSAENDTYLDGSSDFVEW